ncbi:carbon storage regulator CsrA [Pseudalkalibacillus caeni]|uniref:Translational regulator CsrA n=1 Tax=Exobacillus caeni TaxID=2574798 RepID=A0A5R9F0U0_9BACL|nr:carbon storage regulator CsrA [Pseudalkalibacillus caeni]TLS36611.1 carbon storage regulator CsrA [Pseudalkalibacillus caeni]
MLVLARKKGESIVINDDIEVRVVAIEGDTVKLGISAPKSVGIHRKEVYEAIQEENKSALEIDFDLTELNNLSGKGQGK